MTETECTNEWGVPCPREDYAQIEFEHCGCCTEKLIELNSTLNQQLVPGLRRTNNNNNNTAKVLNELNRHSNLRFQTLVTRYLLLAVVE